MKTVLRIVLFLIIWFVLLNIIGTLLLAPVILVNAAASGTPLENLGSMVYAVDPSTIGGFLATLAGLLSTLLAVWIISRLKLSPPLKDFGLRFKRGWWKEALLSLLLGPVIFLFILLLLLLLRMAKVDLGVITGIEMITAIFSFLFVGIYEEILARGFILQTIMKRYGIWPSVIGSSIIFALLHSLNPDVTVTAIIGLFFAGILFAYAYLVTRQLWLPIALHMSWNLSEGPIFGFPVSGIPASHGYFKTIPQGPEIITGGSFGPEAGFVVFAGIALGIAVIYYFYGRGKGILALSGNSTQQPQPEAAAFEPPKIGHTHEDRRR